MQVTKLKISDEERQIISEFTREATPEEIDFNFAMSLVLKLESLPDARVHISITAHTCYITTFRYHLQTIKESTLAAVFYACLDFIKWYGEHKTNLQ